MPAESVGGLQNEVTKVAQRFSVVIINDISQRIEMSGNGDSQITVDERARVCTLIS